VNGKEERMKISSVGLALVAMVAHASVASALPVELKDSNGTRYNVNTEVSPLITNSFASGAVTNATYLKPVTVTSYYVGLTAFGFFFTTYTVQRQVNVPLTPAFAGFNGLVLAGSNGAKLPQLLPYNPAQPVASENCPQNGANRQLIFQPQSFPELNLQLQRQVLVSNNNPWVRWLNIVTNTGTAPNLVGIGLQGLLGSLGQTRVTATSSGDSTVTNGDLWWTTREQAPTNGKSTEPAIGFGVQGAGASTAASSITINSTGQATAVFTPTIQPGQSAIIMTFATVQGNNNDAKNAISKVIGLPSGAIQCITTQQLAQVVNFAPIIAPKLKSATITLNFNKTGADTVVWKGKINIGAGVSFQNLPVTVDLGGVSQSFVLNKSGKGNAGGGNKCAINATLKNGVTKAATDVGFSFNLKGDFQAALAAYDLTNATVQNVPVTIPVNFTAGAGAFSANQAFTYKATQGKTGTAKAPPSS
jgi:hypothetical protein